MKFDIVKVVYLKEDNKLSSDVKIGTKGYFADSIKDLRYRVENECKDFYDELRSIDEYLDFPFNFVNRVIGYVLFYPVEETKEKKYRPYKLEDFDKFFNKGFEHKKYKFRVRVNRIEYENNTLYINGVTAQNFLEKYVWLDGSPCGAEITNE